MSDQGLYYLSGGRRAQIRNYIFYEMFRGVGWGALTLAVIVVPLLLVYVLSWFLPEESKNAPPPMPFSALVVPTAQA